MADAASEDLAQLLARLRPRLHRYCARMAGSALDGEDIVQEALAKAAVHYDPAAVERPEAWMFRVAHNATMDFLRRRTLERGLFVEADDTDSAPAEPAVDPVAAAEATGAALTTFMHLPAAQRSAVILADVLDHALQEIADLLDTTVPAVKAALHRGRTRLRELGRQAVTAAPPALSAEERALARLYAQRFNARDFDGLRALLAEDVRLQLAGRLNLEGKDEVSVYFGNYARLHGLEAVPSVIEGASGLWIREAGAAEPAYAIVLEWRDGQLAVIRDYRYARYVSDLLR
ncbi:sigma-70 family RNA polymerase sigma factor [Piscinibacter sp. XHJ-5]|uniref:sigma-70 family RNA polymerase sigma factor n=1 Tax=Piscinibacter sp. XHJ-5 TaxID=3037797 RepID=UPI002452CC0E|nr:sigma-70 family RNA polymerase sigma factor [Piscinibacter sp. XHJ-5]